MSGARHVGGWGLVFETPVPGPTPGVSRTRPQPPAEVGADGPGLGPIFGGDPAVRVADRLLQQWRAGVARPWVPSGGRVLDVGCFQGEFLRSLGDRIAPSVGLDPLVAPTQSPGRHELLGRRFEPPLAFEAGSFDAVVMLATLEHIRDKDPLAAECRRLLRPGGRVIVTVPSSRVDVIVDLLRRLGLADGMSLDEHHGFDPTQTPEVFARHGFEVEHAGRFQLGLNHLFVLRAVEALAASGGPRSRPASARASVGS